MKIILETPRLILREFLPDEDAAFFFALNNEPEAIRYTGDPPFESVEAARQFLRHYDQYEKFGYGRWAVLLKPAGAWIGWCGLKYTPELAETDIGFRFFPAHWGRGYATEAARACLEYGFHTLGLKRIVGRAMKENKASVRVLEKAGLRCRGEFDFDAHPGLYFVAERKEQKG